MGLSITDNEDDSEACTFIGCDQKSIPLSPCGCRMTFPAFLTHRSRVGVSMIDVKGLWKIVDLELILFASY